MRQFDVYLIVRNNASVVETSVNMLGHCLKVRAFLFFAPFARYGEHLKRECSPSMSL
jgi:hypothetical protein